MSTDDAITPLGHGSEFDRIRAITEALDDSAGPIGDDTAPIPDGDGTLVVSTDVSVENVRFRRDWISCDEIGFRATVCALSDLAAAAALPAGLVVALTVPPDADHADTVEVMRGVGRAARAAGTAVLGGDLSTGPVWSLAVTVFGYATRLMSRRGARVGDGIWVTGWLGGAQAAIRDWTAGKVPEPANRDAFANPLPQLAAGRWLAAHGATAMLDVSDGIAGDAQHLAAASGVRLEIDVTTIPLMPGVPVVAMRYDEDPMLYGATGGEDCQLLVTLPAEFGDDGAEAFKRDTGSRVARIGTVVNGSGVAMMRDGAVLDVTGFRHRV